ncbi:MAG: START-like domain-containing protein, partial [Bacteroidota bacterium]
YKCISNPSSLEEWYADSVNVKNNIITFKWEGEDRTAEFISTKKDLFYKWRWLDSGYENTYCELRIKVDEMTGDVALVITDYCPEDEAQSVEMLWDMAIDDLHSVIGG